MKQRIKRGLETGLKSIHETLWQRMSSHENGAHRMETHLQDIKAAPAILNENLQYTCVLP